MPATALKRCPQVLDVPSVVEIEMPDRAVLYELLIAIWHEGRRSSRLGAPVRCWQILNRRTAAQRLRI
jgi:hypothetical protein